MMSDNERLLDSTLKLVLPYLIFSPPEFRNKLSEQVDSLFHHYRGGDSSTSLFWKSNDATVEMVNEIKAVLDVNSKLKVATFERRYKSFDEQIHDLRKDVLELKEEMNLLRTKNRNRVRQKKAEALENTNLESQAVENTVIESLVPFNENVSVNKDFDNVSNEIKDFEDVTNRNKDFEDVINRNKDFEDVTNRNKDFEGVGNKIKYICLCGHKLTKAGKLQVGDECYQKYICDRRSEGCGKGYLQDTSFDLHKGVSKKALERPIVIMNPTTIS